MPGSDEGRVARLVARVRSSPRYPRLVLITALSGMFATTFPVTILTVSLGDIARDFGTRETVLTWVISGPLLASAVALPILGKMGDLYGHRRVFLLGFGLATIVAGITALSWSAGSLIGFRTVAQVIGAATQPTSMALILGVFRPEDRVKALGWWSLVAAGSPAVGLVAGGPLIDAFGWRLLFLMQAGLAIVPFVAGMVVLRETGERKSVTFDVVGAATLAAGVGGLMLALNQGVEWGWSHPAVVVAAVIAPVGLVAFVRAERAAEHPLLPLEFLRRRNFSAPLISSFFAGAAYMGGFILAPLLLRFVFRYSLSATALLMLFRPLSYSLSSPVGGHIATRLGERTVAVTGTGTVAVALALFAAGAATRSVVLVLAGLVLQGVGNGTARPSLSASLANSVDEADLGVAAASERMVFQVGAAVGITVLTVVYGGRNEADAFGWAYVAGVGLATVAMAAAAFVQPAERGGPARELGEEEAADPVVT